MDEQRLRDAHALFCEVFHKSTPYEVFRHKHLDNPDMDPNLVTLVNDQDGVPAGTNSFMGATLLFGRRAVPVTQSCDTAVLSKFRGRRIFSSLMRQAITICENSRTEALFGFPNQNSYPGSIKLGFCELGSFETYAAVTRPVHRLWSKASGRLFHRSPKLPLFQETSFVDPEGLSWRLSLRCPFTPADFDSINHRPGIHFQRSLPFFQWKLDYLPEGEAAYLCVRQGASLYAYFVLRRYANGTGAVCDWYLPPDPAVSGRLIKTAVRLLRRFCNELSVHMVNPFGEEPSLLASGGVLKRTGLQTPFLLYPTSGAFSAEDLSRLKDLRNWSMRFIDADTILND